MLTLSDTYGLELHAQHTLQCTDYLLIAQLANRESQRAGDAQALLEQLSTWTFEQFFGFTCHLFITTEFAETREQLSRILPKFGSHAVLSLFKVAHHFYPRSEVKQLALQSLQSMAFHPLAVGISQILESDAADEMLPIITPRLVQLLSQHQEQLLKLLAEQLSLSTWEKLEAHLTLSLSDESSLVMFDPEERHIRIRIKDNKEQPAEIAC
ncbi:MAG: hypothetical protein AAFR12_20810 [Cyanobacteria bacterium J06626_6]